MDNKLIKTLVKRIYGNGLSDGDDTGGYSISFKRTVPDEMTIEVSKFVPTYGSFLKYAETITLEQFKDEEFLATKIEELIAQL